MPSAEIEDPALIVRFSVFITTPLYPVLDESDSRVKVELFVIVRFMKVYSPAGRVAFAVTIVSGSQMSPSPSPSKSCWSAFAAKGQLSSSSGISQTYKRNYRGGPN